MSQNATSSFAKMGLRRPPYAFTRNGVAMLSSVLKSQTAVGVNIKMALKPTEMIQKARLPLTNINF